MAGVAWGKVGGVGGWIGVGGWVGCAAGLVGGGTVGFAVGGGGARMSLSVRRSRILEL